MSGERDSAATLNHSIGSFARESSEAPLETVPAPDGLLVEVRRRLNHGSCRASSRVAFVGGGPGDGAERGAHQSGLACRRLGLRGGAVGYRWRTSGNRHAEIKMFGLLELPDSELYRASELSFRDLIRHEAPERITDGSDVRSGVWKIGPQVPDEVQPKRATKVAGARRLPFVPAHYLDAGVDAGRLQFDEAIGLAVGDREDVEARLELADPYSLQVEHHSLDDDVRVDC